jgi:DNA recombination protein RmuC
MDDVLLIIAAVFSLLACIFSAASYIKSRKNGTSDKKDNIIDLEYINTIAKVYNDNLCQNINILKNTLTEKFLDIERRIEDMTKTNEYRLSNMRDVLDNGIRFLQESNAAEIEKMRQVVNEKLDATLETRLKKSFEIIDSRLEAVHKGLGEMQGLAKGVGDLKKVLTNVKIRGTLGEIQLKMLLEQILSPEQYAQSVAIDKSSSERVDFAIILPGKEGEVYLPIDAKFPIEEYNRFIEACENSDKETAEKCSKALEGRIMEEGKKIALKYVKPPYSTDFAIMYLPLEGLYAAMISRPGLFENLQRERIILCGPTTLGALLNSLQMGFKTLAIEKRSSELWQLLSVFKSEFYKFSDLLTKTQKKISEAGETIEFAAKKTRTIERKLSTVAEIPDNEAQNLLSYEEDKAV